MYIAATGDKYDGTRDVAHGGIPKLRNWERGPASVGLQQLDMRPRQPQAPLSHEKRGLSLCLPIPKQKYENRT